MPGPLQDVIVALVAVAALAVVVRRMIGFAAVETSPKCANCESGTCAPTAAPGGRANASSAPDAHPLLFVRPPQR